MFAVHTVREWPGELQGRSGRGCILECSLCGVVSGTHTQGLQKYYHKMAFLFCGHPLAVIQGQVSGVSSQLGFRVICIDSVKCLLISFYYCLPTELVCLLYRFRNFCFYFYGDFWTVFFVKLQTPTVSVFCDVNKFVMCVCRCICMVGFTCVLNY